MSRALRLLLCLALMTTMAAPASAADDCTDPETGELILAEQQVYLHQAETKAGNLGAFDLTGFPGWDSEAPTQSVQQGAGAGYLAVFASFQTGDHHQETGLTLEGTFAGCLDTMLFELYAFLPTNRTGISGDLSESPFNGVVTLDVDGVRLGIGAEVEMKTVPNEGGDATYRLRFAYTAIHRAMTQMGLDPAADHELRFNVVPRYANTNHALFVYDTTEVPAGILFNGQPDDTYTAVPVW